MVQRSETVELLEAWRALAGNTGSDGWRTIPIAAGRDCRLLAARRFPGNEESLLVGFESVGIPSPDRLPQGAGFQVMKADIGDAVGGRVWIGLCRQPAGRLDMFTMMADDIIATLFNLSSAAESTLLQLFLSRIYAWQDFMRRGGDGLLDRDAEVGMFGELEFLREAIASGVSPNAIVEAWRGPLGDLHDFVLGLGAVEVKTTATTARFIANVGSLEQLDDSAVSPLFLAGIRLAQSTSGMTLPEQIERISEALGKDQAVQGLFASRVIHAGVLSATADRYTRRYTRSGFSTMQVTNGFPRLIRGDVAAPIRAAAYSLDLDAIAAPNVELSQVLKLLGVL